MYLNNLSSDFETSTVWSPSLGPDLTGLVPTSLVQAIANRTLREFNPDTFRALCKTVIHQGMTSVQTLEERFPGAIPRNADRTSKKWAVPSPAVRSQILEFFSTLEEGSGKKEIWRHAKPRPAEIEATL